MKAKLLCSLLLIPIIMSPLSLAEEDENQLFVMSGEVFTNDGYPANSTFIKVVPMSSSQSSNSSYTFEGVPPGEQIVRAYFMNDGHTVVYRKMFFDSNIELDWYEGKNWVTAKIYDEQGGLISNSSSSTINLISTGETGNVENGRANFGAFDVNTYYTLKVQHDDVDNTVQYVHFKMERGSSEAIGSPYYPHLNDFEFHPGKNSRYGYVTNVNGEPIQGITISDGINTVTSNSDGFYLLQNLDIGSTKTITFKQNGFEILYPIETLITSGEGWLNASASATAGEIIMPDNVTFLTPLSTIQLSNSIEIEWVGGNHTDYFELYQNPCLDCIENVKYRGTSEMFVFTPEEPGTYVFEIESFNSNGSTRNSQPLVVIVIPNQSGDELWSAGMSWDYSLLHTPTDFHQNKTYTAIGSEVITDAFGQSRSTWIVKVSDEEYGEGEKAYRWVDSKNLLSVKTYWADAPSESSYYQEGHLGWNFTKDGDVVDLLSEEGPTSLHFNRTNIIGVPGHPNGYDETMNSVVIEHGVELTIGIGTYETTHISIIDERDGVVSWELWYNSTVKNYIKIIDQIPGSHSEMVVYELTGFNFPTKPQFINEEVNLSVKDYVVEWTEFEGASSYQLLENGELIYEGNNTNFSVEKKHTEDGLYNYTLVAIMPSDYIIKSDALIIEMIYVPDSPILVTTPNLNEDFIPKVNVVDTESVTISWDKIEHASWYSIIKIDENTGKEVEIYNGTATSISFSIEDLEDLQIGLNRIRAKVTLDNGKTSELSDSIYINVINSPGSSLLFSGDSLTRGSVIVAITITALVFIFGLRASRGRGDSGF